MPTSQRPRTAKLATQCAADRPPEGRYAPPRILDSLLPRPEIAQALTQSSGRLTLLSAPPGSGKTMAMVQHYEQLAGRKQQVRWLTLCTQDNDVPVLHKHLSQAFFPDGDTLPDEAILPPHIHAFVDGLEHLSNPHAHALVLQLLLSVPASSSAYASIHQLHGAMLHEARLRGLVHVLDTQNLRLSTAEAAHLLGSEWPPEHVTLLNQRMQGWAAGLRLLQRSPKATYEWLLDTTGQHLLPSELAEYFEEVLCKMLSPEALQALMELSTLEHFRSEMFADLPAPPCDWALVEQMLRSGWFMQPSVKTPAWIHMHPVLGQYLRQRLQRRSPQRYEQLRYFAAAWNAAQGFGSEAIRHAVQLSTTQAQHIMEQVGAITVDLEDGPDVMLEPLLPPERAVDLPLLFLSQIYHLFRQGRIQESRQLFENACIHTQDFTRIHTPHLHNEVRGWHCIIKSALLCTQDQPIDGHYIDMLENEYHTQSSRNPILAASLASVLAFNWLNEGLYSKATTICSMGLRQPALQKNAKIRLFLYMHQASAAIAQGTLDQALGFLEDGQHMALQECGPQSYEMLNIQLLRAVVYFERNDWSTAKRLLEPAMAHMHNVYGWARVYADVFAMAVQLSATDDDLCAAERVLQAAQQLAHERQLPRLRDTLKIIHLRTLTRAKAWTQAQALLETPEFAAILHPSGDAPFAHSTQVPAILASAQLAMDLGRASHALQWLEALPASWMQTADQRLRFHFHVLYMRATYGLRRYSACAEHWQSAVALARMAGLLHLTCQEGTHLSHLSTALARTRRSPLPAPLMHWLQQVLQTSSSHAIPLLAPAKERSPQTLAVRSENPCLLSPRESEILALIAQGYINKEIAAQLGISEGTVKSHRKHIHEKLGVTSRSQAIQKAKDWLLL